MPATQPNFTKAQLGVITAPTWIVDGDHDEAIKRENTEFMAAQIAASGLVLMAEVSHFASLQDPQQFNDDVLHYTASQPASADRVCLQPSPPRLGAMLCLPALYLSWSPPLKAPSHRVPP